MWMREDLPDHLIESAHAALPILGADAVRRIGYHITRGVSPDGIVADFSGSASKAAAEDLADILEEGVSWDAASCYLMGLADGYRAGRAVQP